VKRVRFSPEVNTLLKYEVITILKVLNQKNHFSERVVGRGAGGGGFESASGKNNHEMRDSGD